jgi:hypothetical protein
MLIDRKIIEVENSVVATISKGSGGANDMLIDETIIEAENSVGPNISEDSGGEFKNTPNLLRLLYFGLIPIIWLYRKLNDFYQSVKNHFEKVILLIKFNYNLSFEIRILLF